jgi:hypothetical protein
MFADASSLRSRAKQCRDTAEGSRDPDWRKVLNDIADELDAAADEIEREGDAGAT